MLPPFRNGINRLNCSLNGDFCPAGSRPDFRRSTSVVVFTRKMAEEIADRSYPHARQQLCPVRPYALQILDRLFESYRHFLAICLEI
jgi:hypothetical protein